MSLIAELKRRNVFKVGAAYLALAWIVVQATATLAPAFHLPESALPLVTWIGVVAFPFVLIFSWAYEITPEGIKRESEVDRSQSITHVTGKRLDYIIVALLVVAIGLFLLQYLRPPVASTAVEAPATVATPESEPAAPASPVAVPVPAQAAPYENSIVVLPFADMSQAKDQEYFSDGISEELLNLLTKIPELRVISRTSSFSYKGKDVKLEQIGRELQVAHVLEGSVRKGGDRIRVTAQLIDVNTDTHLWSETYTRKVDDIFAVQEEIAQAIVQALEVTLSGAARRSLSQHSTANVEAYNKYLQGRHLWNQRTRASLLAAVEPLQEAVALDPQYDQAWAALADAYTVIPEYRAGSIAEYVPKGREAARRALAINPDSARALATQAYIKSMYDYDFVGANADFARAVQLEPGYATGHQWYAEILACQRRTDEALQQIDLAIKADPRSAVVVHIKGWILMFTGRTDEALAQFQAARGLDPLMPHTLSNMETIHLMRGEYAPARLLSAEVARMLNIDQAPDLALIDALENPALKAHAVEMIQQWSDVYDGAMDRAFFFALLGEHELALDNLEKAFAAGDPYAIHMNRVPLYDPLRGNPRFQALLAKMNLLP